MGTALEITTENSGLSLIEQFPVATLKETGYTAESLRPVVLREHTLYAGDDKHMSITAAAKLAQRTQISGQEIVNQKPILTGANLVMAVEERHRVEEECRYRDHARYATAVEAINAEAIADSQKPDLQRIINLRVIQEGALRIPFGELMTLGTLLNRIKQGIEGLSLNKENLEYLSKGGVLLDKVIPLAEAFDNGVPNSDIANLETMLVGEDGIVHIIPGIINTVRGYIARDITPEQQELYQERARSMINEHFTNFKAILLSLVTDDAQTPLKQRLEFNKHKDAYVYGLRIFELQWIGTYKRLTAYLEDPLKEDALYGAFNAMYNPETVEDHLVGRVIWDICEENPETAPGVFRLAQLMVLNQMLNDYIERKILNPQRGNDLIADYPKSDGVAFTHVRLMSTDDEQLSNEKAAFRDRRSFWIERQLKLTAHNGNPRDRRSKNSKS